MKNVFLFLVFVTCMTSCDSHQVITFHEFDNITFEDVWVPEHEMYWWKPVFDDELKSLDGKEVSLKGYFNSFGSTDKVLTNIPYLECYFDETEMILLKSTEDLTSIQAKSICTFSGKLKLNDVIPFQHFIILEDAVLERQDNKTTTPP